MNKCYNTAFISEDKEDLVINIQKNEEKFPLVWLRDNCLCESCFHSESLVRNIDWTNFNVLPKVKSVKITDDDDVILKWDDQHMSKFSIEWLKQRSFRRENQVKYLEENYRPSKIAWNSTTVTNIIKYYNYEEVMKSELTLYNWMVDLATNGVVFIKGIPHDEIHACEKLANKIGYLRKTHYGEEFEIANKPLISNLVYSSGALQLHTDLSYYEHTFGTTMLHCISEADGNGGFSLLSDGLYHVEKLRKENKAAFDILSKVEVNWFDKGVHQGYDFHSIFRCPIIRLDVNGNFDKLYLTVTQRDSYFSSDSKDIKEWYKAFKHLLNNFNADTFKFKLKSGELLVFDNTRIVHGRTPYQDTQTQQRRIVGCSIDWDEIYSKIRVLKSKMK